MKCQFIRDDMEVSPEYARREDMADQIEWRDVLRNGTTQSVPFFKRGAVIEHPNAHWEVHMGTAIPADEACRLRAFLSPEEMAVKQYHYERTVRGIEPDDFEKYDKGQILGYNPDGSFIPGPNFADLEAELADMTDEHGDDEV